MQADVNHVKHNCSKCVASITTPIVPADISTLSNDTSHPLAAVLGMSRNPIVYVTPNTSSVLNRSGNGDSDSSTSFSVSNALHPNMPCPTCMWVPWVSFPPLLTANFHFIDVFFA